MEGIGEKHVGIEDFLWFMRKIKQSNGHLSVHELFNKSGLRIYGIENPVLEYEDGVIYVMDGRNMLPDRCVFSAFIVKDCIINSYSMDKGYFFEFEFKDGKVFVKTT